MNKSPSSLAAIALGVTLATLGGYWAIDWWTSDRFKESTNNAYVRADITTVSARVEGYVEDVLVDDNQSVKKGDLLVLIQGDAFRARLAQGKADLDQALAGIETITGRIGLQDNLITEAAAELQAMIADHELSVVELKRAEGLVADNVASIQRFDIAKAEELRARARLTGASANLAAVEQERDVLTMERLALDAEAQEKVAALELLQIDLDHTEVRAPIDGIIGNRSVRLGQFVRPGSHFMALVPTDEYWVIANFKETQLTDMKAGQVVDVAVDTFPDVTVKGTVDSLSPASGAEFSLLPPENATGNFSKVVQRIPIKITLDKAHPLYKSLKPGMSVVVSVDTRSGTSASGALASGRE